ncbi:MAG TPA: hypothetical protein VFE03_04555 [Caulobacteraceae bacterium]|nr:hypothetical protein [Caulobacteraceae bacterium]
MSIAVRNVGPVTATVTRQILELASGHGMAPIGPGEFAGVGDMAARLMNHTVASPETFIAVQQIQPASSLAFQEDGAITGVFGALLLRAAAVRQLMAGVFDGVDVDLELLSRGAEVPAIAYIWGIASTTKAAGSAMLAMCGALHVGPLGPFTVVTRAVTPVGRHLSLTRYGYQPLRHPDDDMLIRRAERQEVAA